MMKKMAFESKYVTAGEDFPQRRRRLRCFPAKVLFPWYKNLGLTEVQFSRDIENGNISLKCIIMF